MAKVVLSMTMSLDGFVNDRGGSVKSLYPDLSALRNTRLLQESIRVTGAVVMGKNTFAMAGDPDFYADHYEFQVPIFVVIDEAPERLPKQNNKLRFTFVTEGIESAIARAKGAAGDKQVTVVGGANTGQQLLRAGLVDELQVGIMPMLLCKGLRLVEHLDGNEIKLEKSKVLETGARTDIWFRVLK